MHSVAKKNRLFNYYFLSTPLTLFLKYFYLYFKLRKLTSHFYWCYQLRSVTYIEKVVFLHCCKPVLTYRLHCKNYLTRVNVPQLIIKDFLTESLERTRVVTTTLHISRIWDIVVFHLGVYSCLTFPGG
jgi:hypothetical protein